MAHKLWKAVIHIEQVITSLRKKCLPSQWQTWQVQPSSVPLQVAELCTEREWSTCLKVDTDDLPLKSFSGCLPESSQGVQSCFPVQIRLGYRPRSYSIPRKLGAPEIGVVVEIEEVHRLLPLGQLLRPQKLRPPCPGANITFLHQLFTFVRFNTSLSIAQWLVHNVLMYRRYLTEQTNSQLISNWIWCECFNLVRVRFQVEEAQCTDYRVVCRLKGHQASTE